MRETYRNRIIQIGRQLIVCGLLSVTVSCGELFDFEFDNPDVVVATEMHLNTDNLYLMVGDTCSLFPIWTPRLRHGFGCLLGVGQCQCSQCGGRTD